MQREAFVAHFSLPRPVWSLNKALAKATMLPRHPSSLGPGKPSYSDGKQADAVKDEHYLPLAIWAMHWPLAMGQTSQNLPFIPLQFSLILQDQACCAQVSQQLCLADSSSARVVNNMLMHSALFHILRTAGAGFSTYAITPPGRCMTYMTKTIAATCREMSLEDQKPYQVQT